MDMNEWDRIKEESAVAQLHADLAMSSPQSYTTQEVKDITAELEGRNEEIEEAMRRDFRSMSPSEQKAMMDLLASSGTETREWWEQLLLGE